MNGLDLKAFTMWCKATSGLKESHFTKMVHKHL